MKEKSDLQVITFYNETDFCMGIFQNEKKGKPWPLEKPKLISRLLSNSIIKTPQPLQTELDPQNKLEIRRQLV